MTTCIRPLLRITSRTTAESWMHVQISAVALAGCTSPAHPATIHRPASQMSLDLRAAQRPVLNALVAPPER